MSEWDFIFGPSKSYGSSYGSCVRSLQKSTVTYKKHAIGSSDTLQGIALKYSVSTEELRRINKLYSSDSLFLRTFLLIPIETAKAPVKEDCSKSRADASTNHKHGHAESEIDATLFLKQMDSKILAGKNAFKDFQTRIETMSDTVEFRHTGKTKLLNQTYKTDPKTVFSHSSNDGEELFEL